MESLSAEDGLAKVVSDAAIHCIFVNWTFGGNDKRSQAQATELLQGLRRRNAKIPVFLMADRKVTGTISVEVADLADEFVWMLEDTASLIAGRAQAAIERYIEELLPPFTKALAQYDEREYSWAAPGHQGGVAFPKSPIGRVFFDFYGENMFRTDIGIERGALGSLLGHSGPIGESEEYAARIFGAHRALPRPGRHLRLEPRDHVGLRGRDRDRAVRPELPQVDRAEPGHHRRHSGLLQPTRNRYGIIGPIPPQQFEPRAIQKKIAEHPLRKQASSQAAGAMPSSPTAPTTACATTPSEVQDRLDKSVDRIHFDEAWYAYARFNPMYAAGTRCAAIPPIIRRRAPRSSRRTRPTSCSPRSRSHRTSTSATAAAPSTTAASTSPTACRPHFAALRDHRLERDRARR